jgi:hypothetical protein
MERKERIACKKRESSGVLLGRKKCSRAAQNDKSHQRQKNLEREMEGRIGWLRGFG